MPSPCPPASVLARLAAGRADDAELAAVGPHLDGCQACRAAVDATADSLAGAAPADPDPHAAESGLRRAAALVRLIPAPPTDDTLPHGATVAGPLPARFGWFRVVGLIGAGAMGLVYEAEDERLGRRAAVKTLRPALAADPAAVARFLREARATAAVRHPNVVEVHLVGEEPAGPYMAMELLAGEALGARLRRDGRLPVAEAVRVGRAVAAGLAAVHAAGFVHRDVTPDNVWLAPDGAVKLLDFGLARDTAAAAITHPGTVVGTPRYMAPEQARAGAGVDARADLFGLGAVLYHACTGVAPFPGDDTLAVLAALASHDPAPADRVNPAVPARLAALLTRLLAKAPAARPPSAAAVEAELAAALVRPARRWGRAGVVLLALGGAAAWAATRPGPAAAPADPPPAAAAAPDYGLAFAPGTVAEVPGLDFAGGDTLTLECYVRVTGPDPTASAHVLGVPRQASIFADAGGRLWGFGLRAGTAFHASKVPIPARDRWTHLAAVREPLLLGTNRYTTVRLFLDGRLMNAQEVTATEFDASPAVFSVGPGVGAEVDEVRVSAAARYAADFAPARRFDPDPHTLALFHCDDPDAPTLTDASGNGRHGTFRAGRTAPRSSPR